MNTGRPQFDNQSEACSHCPTPSVHPRRVGGVLSYESNCTSCEHINHKGDWCIETVMTSSSQQEMCGCGPALGGES